MFTGQCWKSLLKIIFKDRNRFPNKFISILLSISLNSFFSLVTHSALIVDNLSSLILRIANNFSLSSSFLQRFAEATKRTFIHSFQKYKIFVHITIQWNDFELLYRNIRDFFISVAWRSSYRFWNQLFDFILHIFCSSSISFITIWHFIDQWNSSHCSKTTKWQIFETCMHLLLFWLECDFFC